jgi:C-terminal processing protease CtpA/Prc
MVAAAAKSSHRSQKDASFAEDAAELQRLANEINRLQKKMGKPTTLTIDVSLPTTSPKSSRLGKAVSSISPRSPRSSKKKAMEETRDAAEGAEASNDSDRSVAAISQRVDMSLGQKLDLLIFGIDTTKSAANIPKNAADADTTDAAKSPSSKKKTPLSLAKQKLSRGAKRSDDSTIISAASTKGTQAASQRSAFCFSDAADDTFCFDAPEIITKSFDEATYGASRVRSEMDRLIYEHSDYLNRLTKQSDAADKIEEVLSTDAFEVQTLDGDDVSIVESTYQREPALLESAVNDIRALYDEGAGEVSRIYGNHSLIAKHIVQKTVGRLFASQKNASGKLMDETFTVELDSSKPLGMKLKATTSVQDGEKVKKLGCRVIGFSETETNQARDSGRIQLGDVIIEVNGNLVENLEYEELIAVLKKPHLDSDGTPISRSIKFRRRPSTETETFTVDLDSSKPLGMKLESIKTVKVGKQVKKIGCRVLCFSATEMNQARDTGRIKPGDTIVEIDGTLVDGLEYPQIIALLRKPKMKDRSIKFSRPNTCQISADTNERINQTTKPIPSAPVQEISVQSDSSTPASDHGKKCQHSNSNDEDSILHVLSQDSEDDEAGDEQDEKDTEIAAAKEFYSQMKKDIKQKDIYKQIFQELKQMEDGAKMADEQRRLRQAKFEKAAKVRPCI